MIALALGLLTAGAPPPADPLAPVLKGQVQCYSPDVARKTCRSIGGYVPNPDGSYQNKATVLLSASPLIVMETVAPVTVKHGAVCGAVTPHDIETAHFTIEGQPANAAQAERLRAALTQAEAAIFDHEICTAEGVVGGAATAEVSVDGARTPTMDQRMVWVSPADGFKVAP